MNAKFVKGIAVVAFLMGAVAPVAVVANASKATVMFFHGEGCGHCTHMNTFLDGLKSKHAFDLQKFEVWHNKDNNAKMQQEVNARHAKAQGVPVVIIGDHVYVGGGEVNTKAIEADITEANKQS